MTAVIVKAVNAAHAKMSGSLEKSNCNKLQQPKLRSLPGHQTDRVQQAAQHTTWGLIMWGTLSTRKLSCRLKAFSIQLPPGRPATMRIALQHSFPGDHQSGQRNVDIVPFSLAGPLICVRCCLLAVFFDQ